MPISQTDISMLLAKWGEQFPREVSVGGMLARNPTAHKWRSLYRSLVLREAVGMRLHDLLTQAHLLFQSSSVVGSRILIRSALETLAVLIHLNQITRSVLDGSCDFHIFQEKTLKLLLGSRDTSTQHHAINVLTVFDHSAKRYPDIRAMYDELSETAHPNFKGVGLGYVEINMDLHTAHFSKQKATAWNDEHFKLMEFVMRGFETEYSIVWKEQIEALELWLVEHDDRVMSTLGTHEGPCR